MYKRAFAASSVTVREVLRFEDLPLGSFGTRRAVVRWSDGTEDEALRWYGDLCGHPRKSAYAGIQSYAERRSRSL